MSLKLRVPQATKQGYIECDPNGCFDWSFPTSNLRRGRVQGGGNISPAITTIQSILVYEMSKKFSIRKRTPTDRQKKLRPNGKGWTFVQLEDGKIAWVRIRKLTERECFRLMDVSDEDIDKIQAAGISGSQQYKMAGNSIVVACLEGIFRNLFTTEQVESSTLF